ncbi:zinc finger and BTB domain-containing protein 17-like isoform X1 [Diorhabda sublineata]|uniref:zinc finger and BTB domain-containing protein 17-like isoform X1 n=1 Tax=Diorhabda sublineata TaxID=1163346 RepID=UPI0024E11C1F|nr:zinc finger and BTB domain-containing protein 17-like isoform X1 [Diorhabda sublineata]XP_056632563.1 zinc finger and BTB domain-containing protein 17-like isoform X1 [Diorhabda sublineata]
MSSQPYRYPQQIPYLKPGIAAPAPAMSSQRFCLRWNNHQSNLLSVFDQLLHDESFVDVTLAVEGQLLKAHKMVLSACSPYFQALFINHPDKHPIVILKDVPYNDMRCLLDFMYRGEVSVDQDRLTAFLRVAESLRIKGLTEVNEEKCDTIASSLTQQNLQNLPNLQRLQQSKRFGNHLNMLGNALLQPKRKRGRPRKLSGCSNGPDDYDKDIVQGSPEMLEVKMGMDNFAGNNSDTSVGKNEGDLDEEKVKTEPEPVAGSSNDQSMYNNKLNEDFHPSEEHDYPENNQNHTNLPSAITVELLPAIKQESVIISTEAARHLLHETLDIDDKYQPSPEPEPSAGVHFLSDEKSLTISIDPLDNDSYEKKKSELLEYLVQPDGSVICKRCGEVLASRTHWYRHKYKVHVLQANQKLVSPAPLFMCNHCNVFFKSRKGYTGHIASRHSDTSNQELKVVVKEEIVETSNEIPAPVIRKKTDKSVDWEEQRVKEEKLVADIINRVKKECEAQGATVTRRGYSRRSTSIMNTA